MTGSRWPGEIAWTLAMVGVAAACGGGSAQTSAGTGASTCGSVTPCSAVLTCTCSGVVIDVTTCSNDCDAVASACTAQGCTATVSLGAATASTGSTGAGASGTTASTGTTTHVGSSGGAGGSSSSGSGTPGGGGSSCAALLACCPSIPADIRDACENESTSDEADCAAFLTGWQESGYCG